MDLQHKAPPRGVNSASCNTNFAKRNTNLLKFVLQLAISNTGIPVFVMRANCANTGISKFV
jgi:hypothetical protein